METDVLYAAVPVRLKRGLETLVERQQAPSTLTGLVIQACDDLLVRELPGYTSVFESELSVSTPVSREGTIADTIMQAVTAHMQTGATTFTRVALRDQAGIPPKRWVASFNPILQGMRADHPGGAPEAGSRYKGVFQRVARGEYQLTPYGQQLVQEYK